MFGLDGHGDLAAARASVLTRVPMMATTLSNDPLETVAATLGDMPGFFQLYTLKDKAFAESLIQRAENICDTYHIRLYEVISVASLTSFSVV
jgi:isopentenyl diphosphate isomerase/L-lactate dehydrogenase-like FMN-dependent dehydrogenase